MTPTGGDERNQGLWRVGESCPKTDADEVGMGDRPMSTLRRNFMADDVIDQLTRRGSIANSYKIIPHKQ
jgi:hypothetical protein